MIRLGTPRTYFSAVMSTMDLVSALGSSGAPEGTLVVAGEQTAGRGRGDRAWTAPPGASLLFSLLLRPPLAPDEIGPLPLVAGVAIAEALEMVANVSVRLKWPNDLMIQARKVCGVLMHARSRENRVEFVNLGVGINVLTDPSDLPPTATSLLAATGEKVPLDRVEAAVLDRLGRRYAEFLENGTEPGLRAWMARALYLDETVVVGDERGWHRGRFAGVTPTGALRLTTPDGEIEIVAGDLSRGPRDAEVR